VRLDFGFDYFLQSQQQDRSTESGATTGAIKFAISDEFGFSVGGRVAS
jgi:hypothetical protein